ncbi:MAG: ParB N-terminal domain-containing protein [Desulfopila sp.]|nr:ParB N-terminal domain-containing protein [Desulfopila sp.]
MKIAIDQIQVDEKERIRRDIGDLGSLQNSMETVGLVNPLVIDENNRLIAGYRRLTACKNLGWEEVDVHVVALGSDQLKMLDVEIAENFYRKDFSPEEILSAERRRQDILESRRKKGIWERFLLWLKRLFRS